MRILKAALPLLIVLSLVVVGPTLAAEDESQSQGLLEIVFEYAAEILGIEGDSGPAEDEATGYVIPIG